MTLFWFTYNWLWKTKKTDMIWGSGWEKYFIKNAANVGSQICHVLSRSSHPSLHQKGFDLCVLSWNRTALQELLEPQRNRWSKRHSAHNESRPHLQRHLAPRLFTTMVPATMSYTVLLCWKNRRVTKAGKRKAMEKFLLNARMVDLTREKITTVKNGAPLGQYVQNTLVHTANY